MLGKTSKTNLCVNYLYEYPFRKLQRFMIFGTSDVKGGRSSLKEWCQEGPAVSASPIPPNLALHRPRVQDTLSWGWMWCCPGAVSIVFPGVQEPVPGAGREAHSPHAPRGRHSTGGCEPTHPVTKILQYWN